MELAFGVSAYQRDRGNLPELPVVNMFVEKAPTEPKQVALQSRPGLDDNGLTSGVGPVKGIFQKDGVLDDDIFTFSAGNLYREGASQGAVVGSGHPNFAGNEIGLAFNAGGDIYYHDGTALGIADFPDGAAVSKVAEIGGRFVAIRADTGKLYNTAVLESALVGGILTFGALSFATAEDEPDPLVDLVGFNNILAMGGSETVEFWQPTGDNDLPFAPMLGRVYTKGVRATGCMARFDNTVAYVSTDNLVYRAGNVPIEISTPGIVERIEASATCSIFSHYFEGDEWLNIRLDTEHWVYSARASATLGTPIWFELTTSGQSNFIGRCAISQNGAPIYGSSLDGKTLVFGTDYTELGGELERRFRAGLALNGGSIEINSLRLRTNPGHTTYLTGQFADPVIEMRYSRDAGFTWGNWRPIKLGSQGAFRQMVEARALGTFDAPGALFEFRLTDPVSLRVSGVYANEEGGGRSR